MQRVTLSMDDALAETFDRLLTARGYSSRSEGVRDILRDAIRDWQGEHDARDDASACVADLSYIYDRKTRDLAERISDIQHANHDLIVSTHTVRLDHRHSFESVLLKGKLAAVRAFGSKLLAERGVRFGSINIVKVVEDDRHSHADDHDHAGHAHLHPVIG